MNTTRWIGIVLIVIGIVSLAFGGITYTKKEEVVDVGPLRAKVETKERVPLPPVLGVTALVGGIVLVIVGNRRRAHSPNHGKA